MAGNSSCTCGKHTAAHAGGKAAHAGTKRTVKHPTPKRTSKGKPSAVAAAAVGRAAAAKKAHHKVAAKKGPSHTTHAKTHPCHCAKPKPKPTMRQRKPITPKSKAPKRKAVP